MLKEHDTGIKKAHLRSQGILLIEAQSSVFCLSPLKKYKKTFIHLG